MEYATEHAFFSAPTIIHTMPAIKFVYFLYYRFSDNEVNSCSACFLHPNDSCLSSLRVKLGWPWWYWIIWWL